MIETGQNEIGCQGDITLKTESEIMPMLNGERGYRKI